jgi:hypothetical protein
MNQNKIKLNLRTVYRYTPPETRAVHVPVSAHMLVSAFEKVSSLLYGRLSGRILRHKETLNTLARKTRLPVESIKRTVFGLKPPIDNEGLWTDEALRISRALRSEPEFLFGPVRDAIVAKITKRPQAAFRLPHEPYESDDWKDWAC